MKTLNEIREDLRNIRYYYSRKKVIDEGFENTGVNSFVDTVELYNNIMKQAKPRFYDLYVSLYVKNNTQESLADELCYTPEYVQMLNKKLLKFLQESLNKEEA